MRRVAFIIAVAVTPALLAPAFASAQSDEPAAAPTWQMNVVAGAGGWVAPSEPLPVLVSLSSELLLVGRIDVTIGGVTSSQAIEIPAGGVKDYLIEAAIPGQRRQLRVNLVSNVGDEETVIDTAQVTLAVPSGELVVAAVGADEYETAIRSAQPRPVDQDIQLVRFGAAELSSLNSAVSYLVIPAPAMEDVDSETLDGIRAWVERGGRLIGSASNVDRVADPAAGRPFIGVGAVGVPLGSGEVTAVADFSVLDADAWSVLLRSVPQPGIVRVQEDFQNASLVSAALSGRSASVPALPWLLLGILLFVVLVGPVNFIVLRGFGKPEWAWFTVPVLSALFVAGFWMVGRSQLQPFTVSHTAVVAATSHGTEGHTAFVVQVESGGEHEMRMADGWTSEGQSTVGSDPGVVSTDAAGRALVSFELDDLGVGTAQGRWTSDASLPLGFTLQGTDTGFDVVVDNKGEDTFSTWGVVVDGLGYLATDELLPGSQASVSARSNRRLSSRYQPVIMEAVERRSFINDEFYSTQYQRVYPMTSFAEQMVPSLKENGVFFFGFTDTATFDVEFDGSGSESTGSTLYVVEVPDDASVLAARTSARPRLLQVEGASSVEQYYDEIYAYGAEAVFFYYRLPPDLSAGEIGPGFTALSEAQAYDWEKGEFVDFEWGDSLNLRPLMSPTGDLVVRAARSSDTQFFDESLTLSRFSIDWSSA